jgi:RecJ-like exonuclease
MSFDYIVPHEFIEHIKNVANRIVEWAKDGILFNIYTHLDADGLASGGIFASILKDLGAPFKVRILNQLTDDIISQMGSHENCVVVLLDFGSGQRDLLEKSLKVPCLIIDHHQPKFSLHNNNDNNITEVNPHHFSIDGSTQVSSSGLSYLVAKMVSEKNIVHSTTAIVGALGDRQDCGDKASLIGLNKIFVEEAINNKLLNVKIGLKLFGFESRPIVKSLEYTIDPFIPGLSGDFDACMNFLKSIGVPPVDENGNFRSVSELSNDELRKLIIEIVKYMLNHGITSDVAEGMIGTNYILIKEAPDSCLRDAREFSSVLNACGRMGNPSYGIALCMGIRGAIMQRAFEVASKYRKEISRMLSWFQDNRDKLKSLQYIQYIHLENNVDERLLSTFASLASSSRTVSMDKPLVCFAFTKSGKTKVSCRADRNLIKRGINLGLASKIAAESVGGIGGGHDVASGAEIPLNSEEAFLKVFDDVIGKQISGATHE